MRPLDGLRVLDLTRLLPGPAATRILANFGAEVIKIEEPGRGDYGRSMAPLIDGVGAVFRAVNRGKKSLVLNLKHPEARDVLLRLVDGADVLMEGFRPGVMDRLGVGYQALHERNPKLIYVALTGYGQSGPYAQLAGHDINYLSLGGVLDLVGAAGGPPVIPGVQVADLSAGTQEAVIGVLLALAARGRTGQGQFVDVSMLDGSAALLPVPMSQLDAGNPPRRGRDTLSGRYACYNVYEAADGRWLSVGALEPKFWSELCRRLGCEHFIDVQFDDSRQPEIREHLGQIWKTRTAEAWFELLKDSDCCVTPVRTVAEVRQDPHFVERGIGLNPLLSETPAQETGDFPQLGEHTQQILRAAGFTELELGHMTEAGIIA